MKTRPGGRHAVVHGGTDAEPGRTIYPEGMRMVPFDLAQDGNPGWDRRAQPVRAPGEHGDQRSESEFVVRRECDVEEDELRAAREWLAHVEAGRIG